MSGRSLRSYGLICAVSLSLAPLLAHGQSFPSGATALQEVYQNWRVLCSVKDKQKICTASQTQTQRNGQQLLAVEVRPEANSALAATIVLPFGLLLDSGVVLQVDDKPALAPLRFHTCLPIGCVVRYTFDAKTVSQIRAGKVVKIAVSNDGGSTLAMNVSTEGFGPALDRAMVLSGLK